MFKYTAGLYTGIFIIPGLTVQPLKIMIFQGC